MKLLLLILYKIFKTLNFNKTYSKKYLDENNITDYDFDTIINIDNLMNSLIDYSVYDK